MNRVAALSLLRHLPAFPGKLRAAKMIGGDLDGMRDVTIRASDGAVFVLPSLAEPIALHLLVNGAYEEAAVRFVCNALPDGGTFLDIGANIGTFAVAAARRMIGRGGRVVAVEASPRLAPYLRKNLAINGLANVHIWTGAASDRIGRVPFWDAPVSHFGMGALADQFGVAPVEVDAITVDQMLPTLGVDRVDVMKVDVEGFEAQVFRGASDMLERCRPVIVFEFCDWAERRNLEAHVGAAQEWLLSHGYVLYRLARRGETERLYNSLREGFETLVGIAA